MQVVPHITNEIKERMQLLSNSGDFDIIITEIGGTVGDIESLPYIESVRQLIYELGEENVRNSSYIDSLSLCCRRAETKPTQHSVKILWKVESKRMFWYVEQKINYPKIFVKNWPFFVM